MFLLLHWTFCSPNVSWTPKIDSAYRRYFSLREAAVLESVRSSGLLARALKWLLEQLRKAISLKSFQCDFQVTLQSETAHQVASSAASKEMLNRTTFRLPLKTLCQRSLFTKRFFIKSHSTILGLRCSPLCPFALTIAVRERTIFQPRKRTQPQKHLVIVSENCVVCNFFIIVRLPFNQQPFSS